MAFYSDETIKTDIIEPVVHVSNNRSEFRIKGPSVLSNLRLLNIQILDSGGTSNSNDVVGQLACIRNLYLYDGRNVLCSVRDFNRHQAFKNYLNTNSYNYGINRSIVGNNLGYTSTIVDPDTAISGGADDAANNKTKMARRTQIRNQINDALSDTLTDTDNKAAYLDLKDVFGFLNRIPILSPKVFKDGLRLVVEYHSSSSIMTDRSDTSATLSQRSPLLVVDRVMERDVENKLLSQMNNFEFNEVENDRFLVSATTAGTQQSVEQTIKAFSGKSVERLRLNKNFADTSLYFTANVLNDTRGIYGSVAGFEEKYQITLNGRPIGPEADGFKGKNRGLALTTDSYGSLNMLENGNYNLGSRYESNNMLDKNKKIAGKESFFGLYLGQKVNDLKIQYSRTGKTDTSADSKYNSQLEVFVEAEVKKAFLMQNGRYQIVYV